MPNDYESDTDKEQGVDRLLHYVEFSNRVVLDKGHRILDCTIWLTQFPPSNQLNQELLDEDSCFPPTPTSRSATSKYPKSLEIETQRLQENRMLFTFAHVASYHPELVVEFRGLTSRVASVSASEDSL